MKKVKMNVVEQSMKDDDLIEMFNQMSGVGTPDPNIVIPKYKIIYKNAEDIIQILKSFYKSMHTIFPEFTKAFKEIQDFTITAESNLNELQLEKNDKILTGDDLHEINTNPEKLKEVLMSMDFEYKIKNLGEQYKNLKESNVIKEIIMMARNIKNSLMLEKKRSREETHNLEHKDKLSNKFIVNSDGDYLQLFNFSILDFRQVYFTSNISSKTNDYILFTLYLLYHKSLTIVQAVTSPDIDIDKFSNLLVKYIDNIRSKLPRCDKAFDKIKASVDMLRNNFGEYYKDYVSSRNPGIILEHFVLDVAESNKSDVAVARQFREIVNFCRKNMQSSKMNDPKIQKIFSMVSDNIDILDEKNTKEPEKSDE